MQTQPVAIGGVIQVLLIAILGVINAWYPLTDTQFNSLLALFGAISLAVTWWVNQRTTPEAKPTDTDGTPLVRAGDHEPTEAATAAGRSVVVDSTIAPGEALPRAGAPSRLTWSK